MKLDETISSNETITIVMICIEFACWNMRSIVISMDLFDHFKYNDDSCNVIQL